MQRDEVRAGQQIVKLDLFDPHLIGLVLTKERIVGQHLHFQSQSPGADNATNVACANHAKGFAGQFDAHEA